MFELSGVQQQLPVGCGELITALPLGVQKFAQVLGVKVKLRLAGCKRIAARARHLHCSGPVRRRCNCRGDPAGAALAAGAIGSVLALMGCSLFLGIEELVVELVVWGAVGIAFAYAAAEPLDQRTNLRART